jgi:hypothetical protein
MKRTAGIEPATFPENRDALPTEVTRVYATGPLIVSLRSKPLTRDLDPKSSSAPGALWLGAQVGLATNSSVLA